MPGLGAIDPSSRWLDHVEKRLEKQLKIQNEMISLRQTQDGRKIRMEYSSRYLRRLCQCAWDAAPLCPGWGDRRAVTLKLLAVAYRESRMDCEAVNFSKNKDHSIDVGLMQINSCNWFDGDGAKEWAKFCKHQHLDSREINLLWNPRVNMAYAAWLNQCFIRDGHKLYVYYGYPSQQKIYDALLEMTAAAPAKLREKISEVGNEKVFSSSPVHPIGGQLSRSEAPAH